MPDKPPHQPGGSPALLQQLKNARAQYAAEWGHGNAHRFTADGHYRWMAQFLGSPRTILEVGTGSGAGTSALLSAGHAVISVDENPACLALAEASLQAGGHNVAYESRESIQPQQQGYRIHYSMPHSAFPDGGALLLDGDMLNDPLLLEWLAQSPGVDAIVCWLIGTYFERTLNKDITALAIGSPAEYRMTMHQRLSQVADRVLRKDGVLHFVDRGESSEAVREQYRRYYESQAHGTNLTLSAIDYAGYQEPTAADPAAIKLISVDPGNDPYQAEKAFVSVLYTKRQ